MSTNQQQHKMVSWCYLQMFLRNLKGLKMTVFWAIAPCSAVEAYLDDGGSKRLWNVGKLLSDYMLQQTNSPPWEPEISFQGAIIFVYLSFKARLTVNYADRTQGPFCLYVFNFIFWYAVTAIITSTNCVTGHLYINFVLLNKLKSGSYIMNVYFVMSGCNLLQEPSLILNNF
jgi:hypothetical protein